MTKENISSVSENGYNVQIDGRNFKITEAIRSHVLSKIHAIDKIAEKVTSAHVILEVQKLEHKCSVHIHFLKDQVNVSASADDLYSAIDFCMHRLKKLVWKYKKRLQEKNSIGSSSELAVDVIRTIEQPMDQEPAIPFSLHEVVAKEVAKIHVWNQGEAIMNMEFSQTPFLVYKSEEEQTHHIIYRRDDGDLGILKLPKA
jgi:putative sigma-54 modulation protein